MGAAVLADVPPADSAEFYNPASGLFTVTGTMIFARQFFASTLLLDGRVLSAGGLACCYSGLSSAEIYTPAVVGLITSQTGLTFRGAQESASISPQSVEVLSNTYVRRSRSGAQVRPPCPPPSGACREPRVEIAALPFVLRFRGGGRR